jgi:hypothetical protein
MSHFHDTAHATRLRQELQQFTGDMERYRHGLNRQVIYTPGVQYLAEQAGAYWLIDAIASHIGSPAFRQAATHDPRIAEMHFWKLIVSDNRSALLQATADSGEPAFIEQAIEFTDFILDKIDIWAAYDGQHWTLYLPSEH